MVAKTTIVVNKLFFEKYHGFRAFSSTLHKIVVIHACVCLICRILFKIIYNVLRATHPLISIV